MKLYTIIVLTLLFVLSGFCDQPRSTTKAHSSNNKYTLNLVKKNDTTQVWELIKKGMSTPLYSIEGKYISSKTILVSDDGRHVVTIDDYSCFLPTNTLNVIDFYSDGSLVKSYSLESLLADVKNVSVSSSHFGWLYDREIKLVEPQLEIKTYDSTVYTFDITDGSIKQKHLDPVRRKGGVYVYGKIKKLAPNKFEMDIWHRAWGEIPDNKKIVFSIPAEITTKYRFDKYGIEKRGAISCIIDEGNLVSMSTLLFNKCNVKHPD